MFRTFIILVILTVAGGVAYLSNLSDESKAKAQLNAVRAAVIDYAAANSENFPKPQPFGELVSGDLAQYLRSNLHQTHTQNVQMPSLDQQQSFLSVAICANHPR